jgi:RNA polymerase subunit RPABC4/transcription elongation factor Spt4
MQKLRSSCGQNSWFGQLDRPVLANSENSRIARIAGGEQLKVCVVIQYSREWQGQVVVLLFTTVFYFLCRLIADSKRIAKAESLYKWLKLWSQ